MKSKVIKFMFFSTLLLAITAQPATAAEIGNPLFPIKGPSAIKAGIGRQRIDEEIALV